MWEEDGLHEVAVVRWAAQVQQVQRKYSNAYSSAAIRLGWLSGKVASHP